MTGQATNNQQQANQQQQQEQEQGVTLSKEQYQQVLNSLDELDRLRAARNNKNDDDDDVGSILNQSNIQMKGLTELDWDNMRPAELVKHLEENFTNNGLAPLATAIEGLKIQLEVNELTRDGKHDDFYDLEKDIYKVASKNPNLSVKQAYNLVKSQRASEQDDRASKTKQSSGDEGQSDESSLRHLPRLPQQPLGEKPGGATSITSERRSMSTREAAIKAFEQKVEGKTK